MEKRILAKIYNGSIYLGNLPDDSQIFGLSQEENTAGSQITMRVPLSIDTAMLQSGGSLQDEAGAPLQDEAGNELLTEGSVPPVALGTGGALIKNGNKIVVIEYNKWDPNGIVVFRGTIERWQASVGGSAESDSIAIVCYSDGSDLKDYLLYGPPYTYTQDQAQITEQSLEVLSEGTGSYHRVGQTFTVGAGVTKLGAIGFVLRGQANLTVEVWSSSAQTTLLAAATAYVDRPMAGPTPEFIITLNSNITVTPGAQLFYSLKVGVGQSLSVYHNNTNVYAGGQKFIRTKLAKDPETAWVAQTQDMWFRTYSYAGNTTVNFLNQDPTNGMLKVGLDDYRNRGGKITYTADSIETVGQLLDYKLVTSTILNFVKKMRELAGSRYYWYVDTGTNTLYMKRTSLTADILLVRGRDIGKLDLGASIENVINTIPFSGGKIGEETVNGVVRDINLYKQYTDAASIGLYGPRLDIISDNRVTLDLTANAIGGTALADQKDEKFETVVTLSDHLWDPKTIHVGLLVGFRGYGSFVDTLLMKIVRKDRRGSDIILTLGVLPQRQSDDIEQITRDLIAQQTIGNSTTPS